MVSFTGLPVEPQVGHRILFWKVIRFGSLTVIYFVSVGGTLAFVFAFLALVFAFLGFSFMIGAFL